MDKAEVKAPSPAIVEKAMDKQASGDDLNQREAAALEAQRQLDIQNGYVREQWQPGVWHYRSLIDHDTAFTETEIVRKVNEARVNAFKAARA